MQRYNPKDIEPKWQDKWEADKIYQATEDPAKPKKYVLEYFPYPSGAAMHVGHVRNYTIGDAIARYNRMNGYNVLHPMGWDAFGLPAENYAIKNNVSPRTAIDTNTARFKQQLIQMGFGYDWSREIDSTDPNYYKWTQWFFLLLFKRGLAYQKESPQWWCPVDKTVLANEQVEAGLCWRCGNQVEKKSLKQWFFKITDYADRLADDLDHVNWSDSIKNMQRNWIGRKEGINITYKIDNAKSEEDITVFTTRPDTNFGATFVVLAPEHPFVQRVISQEVVPAEGPSHHQAVQHYAAKAIAKSEIERKEEGRLKTGVFTGFYVVNPLNNKRMPVWVSDFVLAGFGTGAVVGVPGHDMRDFQFATQFDIPIERVVVGPDGDDSPITKEEQVQEKTGKMVNSDFLDGMEISDATQKMMDEMEARTMGKRVVSYSIRDWLISRQRYWGAPIPMVWVSNEVKAFYGDVTAALPKVAVTKEENGKTYQAIPVPQSQLPVRLPELTDFQPDGSGRSPLAKDKDWMEVWFNIETGETVPRSQTKPEGERWVEGERETDTMDGFACSSWYFLRFADPHNDQAAFSPEKATFWAPVDDYIGGAEHAVMHLLYARMWTKVMADEGLIEFNEPFKTLRNHGMILAPDGAKMSKSKGNTIEPGTLIDQGYGADSIRIMELFLGPWNQVANWSVESMGGSYRFLQRIWTLSQEYQAADNRDSSENSDQAILKVTHKTIKKVTDDLQNLSFNTAIAAQMEMVNELYKIKAADGFGSKAWRFAIESLLQLVAPFAPHIAEELWSQIGHQESIHISQWPKYDDAYLVENTVTIAVQVNGKVRGEVEVPADADQATVEAAAKADPNVSSHTDGKETVKVIYVAGKILNIVVR